MGPTRTGETKSPQAGVRRRMKYWPLVWAKSREHNISRISALSTGFVVSAGGLTLQWWWGRLVWNDFKLVSETIGISYLTVILGWFLWNFFIRAPKELCIELMDENSSLGGALEYSNELALWADHNETDELRNALNYAYSGAITDIEERRAEQDARNANVSIPPSDKKREWIKLQLLNRERFLHKFAREWTGEDYDTNCDTTGRQN
jgi:hypothetical protein